MSHQAPTTRLQACVPSDLYVLVREAAALEGLTLNGYILAILRDAVKLSLEKHRVIHLSQEGQVAFANALLVRPPASDALNRATARRNELLSR